MELRQLTVYEHLGCVNIKRVNVQLNDITFLPRDAMHNAVLVIVNLPVCPSGFL